MDQRETRSRVAFSAAGPAGASHADPRQQPDAEAFGCSRSGHILVVDDQVDVRRLLVTALELEGHQVDQASSAMEGLRRLEATRYDLVLSDYAMPGRTGTWMLREAARRGLLRRTRALIITAHPGVSGFGDVHVIAKPLDLDRFLDQVNRMLDACGERSDRTDIGPPRRHTRVELVLYVSSASPASAQARKNLERLLERFDASQVKLSVCDLSAEPGAGEGDCVAFTPTLVKRYPEPRMWVLGDLRESDVVSDLLRACGVDARA